MGAEPTADSTDGNFEKMSPYVQDVASKVGVVKDLENRLEIMQGLDPLMDGILDKMAQVTDHSNLRKIQLDDEISAAKVRRDEADEEKHATIMGILDTTINAIDDSDEHPIDKMDGKVAAINAVTHASATGDAINEARKLRPDVEVHTTEHTNWGYVEPPVPRKITATTTKVNPVPVPVATPLGIVAAAEVNPSVDGEGVS